MVKSKQRGFDSLVGKTITAVNASAINVVILKDEDGNEYEVGSEDQHMGIPVITLEKRKENLRALDQFARWVTQ